jgi:hypothetical protein
MEKVAEAVSAVAAGVTPDGLSPPPLQALSATSIKDQQMKSAAIRRPCKGLRALIFAPGPRKRILDPNDLNSNRKTQAPPACLIF